MRKRLWVTIVNNETARQAVKDGREGAVFCGVLFALLAFDGVWFYHRQGMVLPAVLAVLYAFLAWRIHRESAAMMDCAMILLPLLIVPIWHLPQLLAGSFWHDLLPLFIVLAGFALLNGVRGMSYLEAPLGLPRRGEDDAPGETGVPGSPRSPSGRRAQRFEI
jgi:hypothetical protein